MSQGLQLTRWLGRETLGAGCGPIERQSPQFPVNRVGSETPICALAASVGGTGPVDVRAPRHRPAASGRPDLGNPAGELFGPIRVSITGRPTLGPTDLGSVRTGTRGGAGLRTRVHGRHGRNYGSMGLPPLTRSCALPELIVCPPTRSSRRMRPSCWQIFKCILAECLTWPCGTTSLSHSDPWDPNQGVAECTRGSRPWPP